MRGNRRWQIIHVLIMPNVFVRRTKAPFDSLPPPRTVTCLRSAPILTLRTSGGRRIRAEHRCSSYTSRAEHESIFSRAGSIVRKADVHSEFRTKPVESFSLSLRFPRDSARHVATVKVYEPTFHDVPRFFSSPHNGAAMLVFGRRHTLFANIIAPRIYIREQGNWRVLWILR